MARILAWQDVEPAAMLAFNVWVGEPDLLWARKAWEWVIDAGLASYSTDVERCRVAVRFMALCAFYQEFCQVRWKFCAELCYVEWANALNMPAFRIGQLVGPDEDWLVEDNIRISLALPLKRLADNARSEVLNVVERGMAKESNLEIYSSLATIPVLGAQWSQEAIACLEPATLDCEDPVPIGGGPYALETEAIWWLYSGSTPFLDVWEEEGI